MKPKYVDAKFYPAAFLFLHFTENLSLKPRPKGAALVC